MTRAGVLGLNLIRGWQQRKAEWVDVAWLAMRVHVGRWRKGGVHVIDVQGEEDAPSTPSARKRKAQPPPPPRKGTPMSPPPPPPESPAYGHPGGAGGAGGRAVAEGGIGGVGGATASAAPGGGVGGARDERGGRQPRP